MQCRMGAKFEVEGVEIGMLGLSKEELLVTDNERITGGLREVEGKEVRNGDEERVIAVKDVIVLDEGTRVGEEEV